MPNKTLREYSLDICGQACTLFGTLDKKDPRVDYLNVRMWVTPQCECDYNAVIGRIRSEAKFAFKKIVSDCYLFDGRCMVDISVNPDGMEVGKPSFISVQVFMRQKRDSIKPVHELKDEVAKVFKDSVMDMVYSLADHDFTVSRNKKCK